MTDTNDKLRSLFLTALMVFSVFAGTVAFSGAAAAQAANDAVEVDSSVEFDANSSNPEVAFDGPATEIVFNQSLTGGATVNDVYVDGETGTVSGSVDNVDGEQVLIDLDGDVTPNQNLTIDIDATRNGETQNFVVEDITTTATVVEENSGANTRGTAINTYRGEPVAIVSDEEGESFQLDGNIQADTGSNSFVAVVNNDRFDTGTSHRVQYQGTSSDTEYFNVTSLGLSASTDTSVTTEDDVEVDVNSNRGGPAIVNLTDSDGDEVTQTTITTDGLDSVTANLGTQDEGNYTATVVDNQTGASVTTDTIVVSEAGDEEAGFAGNGVFTEETGDVAEIELDLSNTENATLTIGTRDTNYLAVANVSDESGDGEVTVEFNTYVAGSGNNSTLFDVADDDDSIEFQAQRGAFQNNSANASEALLADVDYEMNVTSGHVGINTSDYNESDPDELGTLGLRSRSTDNVAIWAAPEGDDVRGLNASEVYGEIGSSITQADEIANGDYVVHQVEVSGIQGVLRAENSNATTALFQQLNGTEDIEQEISLGVEEAEGGVNVDATSLTLNASNTNVIADPANDTYFVAVDTTEVTEVSNDTEYEANFSVLGENELADDTESVTANFDIVEPDLSINDGNDVTVRSASGQEISGSTNLAPGTNVTVNIRSSDTASPFLANPETEVEGDGTFTVTEDFSDVSPGTNLTLQGRVSGDNIGDSVDGSVGDRPTASVTFSDQDSDGTTVTVDSVTMSEGGFVAIHQGSASGEVIGNSEYLSAGSQENVEITLDQPLDADATLVAMPHQDTNGNEVYEFAGGSTDAPYTTSGGSPVTDSAEITVQVDTPEPTETEEPEPTETEEPEPTETEEPEPTETEEPEPTETEEPEPTETEMEDTETEMQEDTEPPAEETTTQTGPGFGATIAVLALIAAALLAVRRND